MKTLDQHNRERRQGYMAEPDPHNGIACPQCGKELLDSAPNVVLTSNPPQKNVKCEWCDFHGYRVA